MLTMCATKMFSRLSHSHQRREIPIFFHVVSDIVIAMYRKVHNAHLITQTYFIQQCSVSVGTDSRRSKQILTVYDQLFEVNSPNFRILLSTLKFSY